MKEQETPRDSKVSPRRSFLAAAGGIGAGAMISTSSDQAAASTFEKRQSTNKLPREVRVATLAMEQIRADSPAALQDRLFGQLSEIAAQKPDIVCLPETHTSVAAGSKQPRELTSESVGEQLSPYCDFAREHACYVVCPLYNVENERCYNSAVFIDRRGDIVDAYHKTHATTSEMNKGVCAGPMNPPIIETDFGKVGAQICFDIQWSDGWDKLEAMGADIVFWPSAFGGGKMVSTAAWQHRYAVVSSTLKGVSRICDITGDVLAQTSIWNKWAVADINLEKAFLHTWPYVQRFPEILKKYGAAIRIVNFEEEEWSILESRSADLKIAEVMAEFELKTIREHLAEATRRQIESRKASG